MDSGFAAQSCHRAGRRRDPWRRPGM